MKSISFAKFLTLGCFALLLPVACGDDDDDDAPKPPVGASGAGGESAGGAPGLPEIPGTGTEQTIECGAKSCASTRTALGKDAFIDPCCIEDTTCGVNSGFLTLIGVDLNMACIPKGQPGTLDSSCPSTPKTSVLYAGQMVGVEGFKGCCRPDNTCGFEVNTVDTDLGVPFASPGLGCVDPKTFGAPGNTPCGGGGGGGEGGGGGGGAGGAGGSDNTAGMSSEGGAPVIGAGGAGGAQ